MSHVRITWHAQQRMKQRGIRPAQLALLLDLHDRAEPCGGGCHALGVSRGAAAALVAEGFAPQLADRLGRLRVIQAEDGAIVSVMPRWQRGRTRERTAGKRRERHG